MAAKHEVELFLKQLTLKIKVFGILFLDDEGRPTNFTRFGDLSIKKKENY